MNKRQIKTGLLFLTLLFLMIGLTAVSAADDMNASIDDTLDNNNHIDINVMQQDNKADSYKQESTADTKDISKNSYQNNLKAASNTKSATAINFLSTIDSMTFGDSEHVTFNVLDNASDDSMEVIPNISVSVNNNGELMTLSSDDYGWFDYVYTPKSAGKNYITVSFKGDSTHKASKDTITFDVLKQDTAIGIDQIGEVNVGKTATISGSLTDINAKAIKNAKVQVSVNDKVVATTKMTGKYFSVDYAPSVLGTNNVTVSYAGDDSYNSCIDNIQFEYAKMDTMIVSTFLSDDDSDKIFITYQLRNKLGVKLKNCNIKVKSASGQVSAKTDSNGKYVYEYNKNSDTNNIIVTYAGNSKYNKATNTLKITNNKVATKMDIRYTSIDEDSDIISVNYGEKITIKTTLKDDNNNIIPNQKVKININNKEYTSTTDQNGIYAYTITADKIGTNNVTATFESNKYYKASTRKSTFKVTKLDTEIYLTTELDEKTLQINGGIICNRNDLLSKETIKLTINSQEIEIKSDQAKFSYNYTITQAGTQTIEAKYLGNNIYNQADDKIYVYVEKIESAITNTLQTKNNNILITYHLKDAYDNKITNANIQLTVNGQKTTYKTDSQGQFTYTYAKNTNEKTITATFKSDKLYSQSTNTLLIDNNKIITDLDMDVTQYGNITNICGYLYDSGENSIASQVITLKVNNNRYIVKTDKNGYYTHNYTTITGTNQITATYSGNSIYSPVTTDSTLEVLNIKTTKISLTISKQKYMNQVELKGKILDSSSRQVPTFYSNVQLTLNGQLIPTDTANGQFVTSENIVLDTIGKNNVTIRFEGEDEYCPSTLRKTFIVDKQNTKIDYNHEIIESNGAATIRITGYLKDANNNKLGSKNIKIKINNREYTAKTDNNGYFIHDYKASKVGEYDVTLTFMEDDHYNKASENEIITITKKKTRIDITPLKIQDLLIPVTIMGQLTDSSNNALSSQTVNIQINNDQTTVKTDENGYYYLRYNAKVSGKNNVIISFKGNSKYKSSKTSSSFTVKTPASIAYFTVKSPVAGKKVKISGKLTFHSKALKNQQVIITVNDKKYNAKTFSSGYFTVNHTVDTLGKNNLTFTYNGNDNIGMAVNRTTFNVYRMKASHNPTMIECYSISPVLVGKTIKVSGKLLAYKKGVKSQNITVTVNGKKYRATTYSSGYFTVSYKTGSIGRNNISFAYSGNSIYSSSRNKTTFYVVMPTALSYYKIKTASYGSTVKISGKLLSNSKAVKGQNVIVRIGDETLTAKTFSSGYFSVNYKVNSYDKQKVSFAFDGSSRYMASKNQTTLNVKKQVTLSYFAVMDTLRGSTVKISGKLLSKNKGIKGQKVSVKVNGQSYDATTYSSGYFTVSYKTTVAGKNNVTFSYDGSTTYEAKTNKTTFNVI